MFVDVCLFCALGNRLMELLVLGRKQFGVLVEDEVIKDVCCPFHAFLLALRSLTQGFLGVNVTTPDEELLQLEHVVAQVLVGLQEGVFVLCILEPEVLVSEAGDGSLLILGESLDLFDLFDELSHRFFQLCCFIVNF